MNKVQLLLLILCSWSITSQTNLVPNGGMEIWSFPGAPNQWTSSSDSGSFFQNTTDFIEGSSSIQLNKGSDDLNIFTLADIPLQAGITYDVQYSYKYLGSDFNSADNLIVKILFLPTFSNPFESKVNIQNNNWNTVLTEFTPTITNSDYEVEVIVSDDSSFDYEVLVDDIRIVERPSSTLDVVDFEFENDVRVISQDNKIEIDKPSTINIQNIAVFSLLGIKQNLYQVDDSSIINLNNLSSGVYILRVLTDKGAFVKKVLVI